MVNEAQPTIQTITPVRVAATHEHTIYAIAVFPEGRHVVTALGDNTLRLWDLKDDGAVKKMEGHRGWVWAVAVSRDERFIASGDHNGELIIWNVDTGESLTSIEAHSAAIHSVDFSQDGEVLATGSKDKATKLWNVKSWKQQGNPIACGDYVHCIRYSPFGEHLAIATSGDIQIWNPNSRHQIKTLKAHAAFNSAWNYSLSWASDGRRLFTAGSYLDPTIREWDTSTWEQVGHPCTGRGNSGTKGINTLTVNPAGTLVASTSYDHHVRLWRLSDRRIIASFKHSHTVCCVVFSTDGKYILSGGLDKKVSQWAVPSLNFKACFDRSDLTMQKPFSLQILEMDSKSRDACIAGDLNTAEALLTQQIDADNGDHNAYANRSFVRARKAEWSLALDDALKSIEMPSLTGYLSSGIALCGNQQISDAMKNFNLATMFTDGHSKTILLLVKAIALFNAKQHCEAIPRIQQPPDASPTADSLACSIAEVYLDSLDGAHRNGAAGDFTATFNTIAGSSESTICSEYEDFTVLFGCDLKLVWQISNQRRCDALVQAGETREALELYRYMMNMSDEATKAKCLDWSTTFEQACRNHYIAKGFDNIIASADAAFNASNYDEAIELYSAAINLNLASDAIFTNRSKAKSGQRLWEDAFLDAQEVIKLDPSDYLGYQLKHAVLNAAQHYDEAIDAFQVMLSKLDSSPDTQQQELRQQYVSQSDVEKDIEKVIRTRMDHTPIRVLDTSTGRLCDRKAQMEAFKRSTEYKELLSSITRRADLRMERIRKVVANFFGYVMLSHRWEGKEPLLCDIQGKSVYELHPVDTVRKLQRFCEIARDAGYRWAWSDTCCINKADTVELPESITSMFRWYQYSALTIVYLSDILPLSASGALASSIWITRGWTLQEFLAPNIILFYRNNWTPYLDHHSNNHKEFIMQELKDVTGIDSRFHVAFRPGMRDPREKLVWASKRDTEKPEDVAYSLFGIFGVHLPVIYGENKQKALGRLLGEIVAQSRDISVLDWVGKSSEFNSCLPADIKSYGSTSLSPCSSEDQIQESISSLRVAVDERVALDLYDKLSGINPPNFSTRRLHLPCMVFRVTQVKRRRDQDEEILFRHEVKAKGLQDLLIATDTKLPQFSRRRPTAQKFLLVRPWDRRLLELPDFSDDTESVDDLSPPPSPSDSHCCLPDPGEHESPGLESRERALRLIAHLKQPFRAFLLGQKCGEEYTRMISEHDIIAQVAETTSIRDIMECVTTVEVV
ncbi:uncharacterized protein EDB93DRAFT_1330714 [Suillus bovinus]|uniref:uncharacterized protein n=1 Tax=Suillus bovinus TaxID=48563 RepID=UPI001B88714C|nr:uncharacterized protein EDB93DRAFT_1330714 [Suillus bovinus]KAG2137112.1 hypothetical protein EDB93DRAFT_1330714 [Suillus bovinus]